MLLVLLFYFISISSDWKAYIKSGVCNLVYLNENEIDCFQLVIEDTPPKKKVGAQRGFHLPWQVLCRGTYVKFVVSRTINEYNLHMYSGKKGYSFLFYSSKILKNKSGRVSLKKKNSKVNIRILPESNYYVMSLSYQSALMKEMEIPIFV